MERHHIDSIFNEMIDDVIYIKLASTFKRRKEAN